MLRANKILTVFAQQVLGSSAASMCSRGRETGVNFLFLSWICHGSIRCWMFWSICNLGSSHGNQKSEVWKIKMGDF